MRQRSLSVVCSATLPAYIIGYSLFLVSFTFPNWVKRASEDYSQQYNYGLWWNCSTELNEDEVLERDCRLYEIGDLSSMWIVSQGFYIVAIVLGFVACTIYPKIPVTAAFQSIAGLSILLSTIIFATTTSVSEEEKLDWAFALGPVSGALLLGNGLVLAYNAKRSGCLMVDVMPPEIR